MARYEHLPLYKTAMVLTVYIETVVRTFSQTGNWMALKEKESLG